MNYTLNQVIKKIQDFCDAHPQVKSFDFGEQLYISNIGKEEFVYIYAVPQPSSIQDQIVKLNILIICCDLVSIDKTNQSEVWSDTLQILTDLRAYLNDPDLDDYFVVDNNTQVIPFNDKYTDNVSGWTMNLVLNINDLKDRCAIPQ